MKLSNFLVGALVCAMAAACTNDTYEGGNENNQQQQGNAYMAINLGMGNGAGTRATGDYSDGTEDEGAVKASDAAFYFYDSYGNYLTKGTIDATDETTNINEGYLTWQTGGTDNDNIENQSAAIIVLGPTQTKPSQVLAVLNTTTDLSGKSLNDAVATIHRGEIATTKGSFIMTNSVYMSSDNKVINAQAITESNIKENPTEARSNAVNIYVERIVAKVSFKSDKTEFELENVTSILDGESVSMKVVVDGWNINAYNNETYLVKNLDTNWNASTPFSNWNAASSYRSFWAKDANYDGTDPYTYATDGTYNKLQYNSWADATKKTSDVVYCYENTVNPTAAQAEGGDYANVTTILIAAHVATKGSSDETYTQQDLYKKNGVYYTGNTLQQNIATTGNYYWYKSDASPTHVALGKDDITMTFTPPTSITDPTQPVTGTIDVTIKDKEGYALVQGEESTTTVETTTAVSTMEASPFATGIELYKNGACYYQVPIEQYSASGQSTVYGVVRNHSYVLTLNSISRVGYPVYNPDSEGPDLPIIPGEQKDYYVAATLNILAWRVMEQSVEL